VLFRSCGVLWGRWTIGRTSIAGRWRERKVIAILTNPALIDRISADRRGIKILQHNISAMATNEIVPTSAPHSSFCFEYRAI